MIKTMFKSILRHLNDKLKMYSFEIGFKELKSAFKMLFCRREAVGKDKKRQRGQGWVGIDLISQGAAPPVPSARVGLTAGFEMRPGVPPPPKTPTTCPQ
jgi:hypothetical protein